MEVFCRRCNRVTRDETGFCNFCLANLSFHRLIELEDFQHPDDRQAIGNLELAKSFLPFSDIIRILQKSLTENIVSRAISASRFPKIIRLVLECARTLSLEYVPEVIFVKNPTPNAFTFGTDEKPIIAINLGLIKFFKTPQELKAVLGHEMGHIKSKHITFHGIAEMLITGASFLGAGVFKTDLISIPLRMMLMSWYRKSELTADRASLIIAQDKNLVAKTIAKTTLGVELSVEDIERRLDAAEGNLLQQILHLKDSHPSLVERVRAIQEFAESAEYRDIQLKLRKAAVAEGEVLYCKFCGAPNLDASIFCPVCKKSQL